MPTGDRPPQQGFSYLGVLLFVAISSAALAQLGPSWQTALQRERERELEFRGQAIARAIESFAQAGPAETRRYPRSFDELLVDTRGPQPRHHLRQHYPDPFTGDADWGLILLPQAPGQFKGVHSQSKRVLLALDTQGRPLLAMDRRFMARENP